MIIPEFIEGGVYGPINIFPHYPPLGSKWGFTGGTDTKLLPHYGAFDKGINRHTSYQFKAFVLNTYVLLCNWGLCGAVLGDLTCSVCPTIGHLTSGYVKSPL